MLKYADQSSSTTVNVRKTLAMALLLAGAMHYEAAHAAPLPTGTVLTITSATFGSTGYVNGGSYFGMDTNANGVIGAPEKTGLAQGTQGLIIGVTQAAGGCNHFNSSNGTTNNCSYTGTPVAGDISYINAPWAFFGNTGKNYTTAAITGEAATGLSMNGWTVTWNFIPAINMGNNAWGTGYTSGVANFVWDGVYGHAYTLDYHATVPIGDPSGFGNVKYALHLVGTVNAATAPVANPVTINVPQNSANFAWSPSVSGIAPYSGCTIVAAPANGTATIAPDCTSGAYTPTGGYAGPDSFTYQATDASSLTSNAATVSVSVSATPPPTAVNDTATTIETTPVPINVTANDVPGYSPTTIDTTTVAITTPAANGKTSVNGVTGVVTYTANVGFTGTDTFQYTVKGSDGQASAPATVTIQVQKASTNTTPITSTSGCSLSSSRVSLSDRGDWLLLLGFITWLGMVIRRRQHRA